MSLVAEAFDRWNARHPWSHNDHFHGWILRNLPELKRLGLPILVAASRKDFIGESLGGLPPAERMAGTAAAVTFSIMGGANVLRVHDVEFMGQVVRMTEAMMGMGKFSGKNIWSWWEPMRASILRGPPDYGS